MSKLYKQDLYFFKNILDNINYIAELVSESLGKTSDILGLDQSMLESVFYKKIIVIAAEEGCIQDSIIDSMIFLLQKNGVKFLEDLNLLLVVHSCVAIVICDEFDKKLEKSFEINYLDIWDENCLITEDIILQTSSRIQDGVVDYIISEQLYQVVLNIITFADDLVKGVTDCYEFLAKKATVEYVSNREVEKTVNLGLDLFYNAIDISEVFELAGEGVFFSTEL